MRGWWSWSVTELVPEPPAKDVDGDHDGKGDVEGCKIDLCSGFPQDDERKADEALDNGVHDDGVPEGNACKRKDVIFGGIRKSGKGQKQEAEFGDMFRGDVRDAHP